MRTLTAAAALVLLVVASRIQARIDAILGTSRAQEEVLYLWSGEQVRRLFPGFENLAADIYWLRTVQYFGGQRLFAGGKRFELLRPLTEITTTLDPKLEIAYRYGATFLCEKPPIGAGEPRAGVALLEKGVRNLPRSWVLWQNLGYFNFLFLHDPARAATVLNQAAGLPGAPFWLRSLGADLLARGGDRATARRMWQQILDHSEEGILKENARLRLQIYDSLDLADHLTALVAAFEKRTGRRPASLPLLQQAGLWAGPLRDGAGVPFAYDVSTGQVTISRGSPLWRPD